MDGWGEEGASDQHYLESTSRSVPVWSLGWAQPYPVISMKVWDWSGQWTLSEGDMSLMCCVVLLTPWFSWATHTCSVIIRNDSEKIIVITWVLGSWLVPRSNSIEWKVLWLGERTGNSALPLVSLVSPGWSLDSDWLEASWASHQSQRVTLIEHKNRGKV